MLISKYLYIFLTDWYPQALVTAFEVYRIFVVDQNVSKQKQQFYSIFANTLCLYLFRKTSHRRGTQSHAEQLSV